MLPASWQKITSPFVNVEVPDFTPAVRLIGDPEVIVVTAAPFEIAASEVAVADDAGTTFTVSVVEALDPPEVPVIVTVAEPADTVLSAVSVMTVLPVDGFGENEAITPAGKPVTVKLILPLKPFSGFTRTLDFVVPPEARVTTPGASEIVKDCCVIVIDVDPTPLTEPEVPVMVICEVPGAALLLTVSVRTLELVVGFVANAAVTPLGRPETAKVTLPLKPYCG